MKAEAADMVKTLDLRSDELMYLPPRLMVSIVLGSETLLYVFISIGLSSVIFCLYKFVFLHSKP